MFNFDIQFVAKIWLNLPMGDLHFRSTSQNWRKENFVAYTMHHLDIQFKEGCWNQNWKGSYLLSWAQQHTHEGSKNKS
jgi:hypothetical protein